MKAPSDTGELARSHRVDVSVGDLGAVALAEEAAVRGLLENELIAAACDSLIGGLAAGTLSAEIPPFPGDSSFLTPETAARQRIAVELSNAQWTSLNSEAALHHVSVDRIVAHAILAFLARDQAV